MRKELFPNLIDPSCKISKNIKLGYGNIIYPHTIICSNSKIEDFCHLTYSTILAHNVKIGSLLLLDQDQVFSIIQDYQKMFL